VEGDREKKSEKKKGNKRGGGRKKKRKERGAGRTIRTPVSKPHSQSDAHRSPSEKEKKTLKGK